MARGVTHYDSSRCGLSDESNWRLYRLKCALRDMVDRYGLAEILIANATIESRDADETASALSTSRL